MQRRIGWYRCTSIFAATVFLRSARRLVARQIAFIRAKQGNSSALSCEPEFYAWASDKSVSNQSGNKGSVVSSAIFTSTALAPARRRSLKMMSRCRLTFVAVRM